MVNICLFLPRLQKDDKFWFSRFCSNQDSTSFPSHVAFLPTINIYYTAFIFYDKSGERQTKTGTSFMNAVILKIADVPLSAAL